MTIRKLCSGKFSFIAMLGFMFVLAMTSVVSAQDMEPAETVVVPNEMDLKACVERGLEANPSIVAARAQLSAAGAVANSAITDMLPSATTTYGYQWNSRKPAAGSGAQGGWTLHFNLSQPVFRGFKLLSSLQKALLQEEGAEAKLYQAELTLISEIQSNFFMLLKGRMDVKSAEDSVARLESQLKVSNAFYEVGLKPRLDVLQAEVQLATAEESLLRAKNAVSTQEAKLNSLLDYPLEEKVNYVGELKYIPFDKELKECLDRAYRQRPDLVMGAKSVEMAAKDANIALGSFLPNVTADWDYYRFGDDPGVSGGPDYNANADERWTAGMNLSWTLSGSTYFDYDSFNETFKQMVAELENTKLNAGYSVKAGLLNLQNAKDRIKVAQKSVEAAKESYRMSQARYQAQVGTSTDVLDAQSNLSNSEAQLIEALADYQVALSGLYVSMGEKNPGLETE